MIPTLYLVRHGNTDLNNPSSEAIRGWSDIPINADGREVAEQAAKELLHAGITHIVASDLQRTMLTAQIIADRLSVRVVPSNSLRPWNLGQFNGKPVKDIIADLNHYQEFPDLVVPGGESYNDFYQRWSMGLRQMLNWSLKHPGSPVLAVTHSRNLLSLPSIIEGTPVGAVPVKGGPAPGCITKLTHEDSWVIEELPCHS